MSEHKRYPFFEAALVGILIILGVTTVGQRLNVKAPAHPTAVARNDALQDVVTPTVSLPPFAVADVLPQASPKPAVQTVGDVYRIQTAPAPRADELRLEGPAKAKPGQIVRLQLLGTPPIDVSKPLVEQLGWASLMQMKVLSAQDGATLDGSLIVAFPLSLQLRLEFVAEKPGDYWIVIDWNHEKPQLLTHRITVEGAQPTPGPTPGPTPDPTPPPGPKYAVIVEESSQRTPAVAAIIKDPSLRDWAAKEGHVLRVVDKDSQVPADLEPYVKLAAGKKLPRLIVVEKTTGKIFVDTDLPGTSEQVKTLIGTAKKE